MKIDVRFAVLVLIFCSLIPCCAGVVFCPDDRFTMPISNTLPWGAVGYMDNGCTATLIDSQHIVAAAHCFVNDEPGSWQLSWQKNPYPRFYPNLHSIRSLSYFDIDRAVVGTRVKTGGEFQASDWGIGHLTKPVKDFPSMPISSPSNTPINNLISSGYGRDPHFFTPQCGNVWWQSALVDPNCTVYNIDKDQLFFDCGTVGGNSGSPIIQQQRKRNYVTGKLYTSYDLIGVIHGSPDWTRWHGWWDLPNLPVDAGSPVSVVSRGANNLDAFVVGNDGGIYDASWDLQTGWKGWGRVLDGAAAPGSLVAGVSRSPGWFDIFAVGTGGGIYTASWNPTFTDGWHGWWNIPGLQVNKGTPVFAASKGANSLDVFVVGNEGGIYDASWDLQNGWKRFGRIHNLQAQPNSLVSAVSRSSNKLDIFVTGNDGIVYTSSLKPYNNIWQSWSPINGIQVEPGSPVSAVSRGPNNLDIFVVGKDGWIYTTAKGPETGNVWRQWRTLNDLVHPPLVFPKSYIAAVSRGTDKIDIFVVDKEGRVYNSGVGPYNLECDLECGLKYNWHYVTDGILFKPGSYVGATSRSTDLLDIVASSAGSGVKTAAWRPAFSCIEGPGSDPLNVPLNAGPSAKRFQYAPRYAENVALARYIDGSPRTQIFVADSDSDQVVTRSRNSNSIWDGFSTFDTLGSVNAPRRITAFLQTNGKPQIVVTSGNGKLYTRAVAKDSKSWKPWTTIDLPSSVNRVLDVDAAYDSEGTNQIFIVGDDGNLYTRGRVNKKPDSAWKDWQKLTKSGIYRKVTSVRRSDGTEQVFLVDSTGSLATLWQLQAKRTSLWSMAKFEAPYISPGMRQNEKIIDIDAALTEDERVQLFAVDNKGGLWIQTIMPKNPSNGWQPWDTHLYAPDSKSPPEPQPEGILSLTASRWQEETDGDIVPVVFATDNRGNIYYTEHTQKGGWSDWKSFYQ